VIRLVRRDDLDAFRALRLEALRLCPAAFGASFEAEQRMTDTEFAQRIPDTPPDAVFGAFADDGTLFGMLGFRAFPNPKERHKAMLWGIYVRPDARGRGTAAALLRRAIEHATRVARVETVLLTVTTDMIHARALYDRTGFVPYGLERRALRLGPDDYRDEELRALDLRG
jgi:ribosomal protein S18 acetylase RimI-like enzyme